MSSIALPIALFLLVTTSIGGLLFVGLYPRLAARSQANKRLELIAQGGSFASRRMPTGDEKSRQRAVEKVLHEIDEQHKAKAKKGRRPSLLIRMRQAGIGWSKATYFLTVLGVGFLSFCVALTLIPLGLLTAAGFGVAGGLLLPHFYVSLKRNARFKAFAAEFPNAVDVVVRGVKSGLPLVDCLKIIAADGREPVKSEFKTMVEDQTLGLPLDEVALRLVERVPISGTSFFAIVIAIQSRSGGNLSYALGNLSKVLRDRKKMQAKIKAMSSEAKASAGIIGSMPIVVSVLIYLTSPDYISLLFTTLAGNAVLVAAGLWMLVGILVMRKMIKFDF